MTRPRVLAASLLIATATLVTATADGQYMFLDFDGDGIYTLSDEFGGFGYADSTKIDLYLVTDRNRDGSTPTCVPGVDSYAVNLFAQDAPVTFSSVTNRMPGMTALAPVSTYPYALAASFGGSNMFPPGKYRLMSMTVVFGSGCRILGIVSSSCFSPPGLVTSFGSDCLSNQVDYTLRLGDDWNDGLGTTGCTDITLHTPTVTSPPEIAGTIGEPIHFTILVDAPDCYVYSFNGYGLPPGATLGSLGPVVYGKAEAAFDWTPTSGQAGVYPITFEASNPDWFNMRDLRDTCVTSITVREGNHSPVADPGGPYSGLQDVPVRFDATRSSDPDGDPLEYAW
ncbi:MAG TPA: putative Ig domain-containing protein, partial [Candidatus Eisenbacteria bacterium]